MEELTCGSCLLAPNANACRGPLRWFCLAFESRMFAFARCAHSIVCHAQDHVQRFETIAGRSAMVSTHSISVWVLHVRPHPLLESRRGVCQLQTLARPSFAERGLCEYAYRVDLMH